MGILVSQLAFASPKPNCEAIANAAPQAVDKMQELIECLSNPDTYSPSWKEDKDQCEHCLKVGQGDWCIDEAYLEQLNKKYQGERDPMHDPGVRLESCGGLIEQNTVYCFDGVSLVRDPGNLNLMYHLCNGNILDKGIRVQFGSCSLGQRIKTAKLSCFCQYQGGDKNQPLAFHCTGL